MATLSKMVEMSSYASAESILQHSQKDDIAFLALIILSGIFYQFYLKDKPDPYHHIWFEKPQQADANGKGTETRNIGLKLEESVSTVV
jgi:NADPH-ferrihemoprotein reductase